MLKSEVAANRALIKLTKKENKDPGGLVIKVRIVKIYVLLALRHACFLLGGGRGGTPVKIQSGQFN